MDEIEVNPVLIQKGETKLALYGLGNVRDERLNRMWSQKKVKFLRPAAVNGEESFFSLFTLHQVRTPDVIELCDMTWPDCTTVEQECWPWYKELRA